MSDKPKSTDYTVDYASPKLGSRKLGNRRIAKPASASPASASASNAPASSSTGVTSSRASTRAAGGAPASSSSSASSGQSLSATTTPTSTPVSIAGNPKRRSATKALLIKPAHGGGVQQVGAGGGGGAGGGVSPSLGLGLGRAGGDDGPNSAPMGVRQIGATGFGAPSLLEMDDQLLMGDDMNLLSPETEQALRSAALEQLGQSSSSAASASSGKKKKKKRRRRSSKRKSGSSNKSSDGPAEPLEAPRAPPARMDPIELQGRLRDLLARASACVPQLNLSTREQHTAVAEAKDLVGRAVTILEENVAHALRPSQTSMRASESLVHVAKEDVHASNAPQEPVGKRTAPFVQPLPKAPGEMAKVTRDYASPHLGSRKLNARKLRRDPLPVDDDASTSVSAPSSVATQSRTAFVNTFHRRRSQKNLIAGKSGRQPTTIEAVDSDSSSDSDSSDDDGAVISTEDTASPMLQTGSESTAGGVRPTWPNQSPGNDDTRLLGSPRTPLVATEFEGSTHSTPQHVTAMRLTSLTMEDMRQSAEKAEKERSSRRGTPKPSFIKRLPMPAGRTDATTDRDSVAGGDHTHKLGELSRFLARARDCLPFLDRLEPHVLQQVHVLLQLAVEKLELTPRE